MFRLVISVYYLLDLMLLHEVQHYSKAPQEWIYAAFSAHYFPPLFIFLHIFTQTYI